MKRWLIYLIIVLIGYTSNAQQPFAAANTNTRTVYLKDVKGQDVGGGTFTSGAWRTRDLNTIEGDTSFITLSSNQFTLEAGTYEIEAEAVAFYINRHKAMLYNITDGSNEVEGSAAINVVADGQVTAPSVIIGVFTITSSKTFEIQHRCQTTRATNGFGVDSDWDSSIFTQVKITKLKL